MAKSKSTKKADEKAPEGPQDYEVTAAQNLGATITGGPRIAKGKKGTVTLDPDRYARLEKAGYFKG